MAQAIKITDVELEKRLAAIEYARGSIAHLATGRNLADELIADRRAEARAENASGPDGLRRGDR